MAPENIVKLGIAHTPEGRGIFPRMSTFDNIMVGAYLRKDKTKVQRDLERIYERFPMLRSKRRQQAGNLSGGQQQIVAFGRALLSNPKLFLFDEPSLGLAPILVKETGAYIRQLAEEGYSVILIEQNASLALSIAKKAYILEVGRVTLEGDGKQLQNNEDVKKAYIGIL